jgi:hypothetical protein
MIEEFQNMSTQRTTPVNLLNKIDPEYREKYYPRDKHFGRPPYAENMPKQH